MGAETLTTYRVGVAIDGVPTYVVELNTTQGRDAAERRARFTIAAQHRFMDLDRITICEED